MKHKTVIKNLIFWMEGKLSDSQRQELENHLNTCPDCREYYRKMQTVLENPDNSAFPHLTADPFLPARIRAGEIRSLSEPSDMPLFDGLRWSFVTLLLFIGITLGGVMGYSIMSTTYQTDASLPTQYYQAFNPGDSYFQLETVVDLENGGVK